MATPRLQKLLRPARYDQDARILGSESDGEFESNGADELSDAGAGFLVDEEDRAILKEEEERENLLVRPSRFDAVRQALRKTNGVGSGESMKGETRRERRQRKRGRRRKRRGKSHDDAEVMFEMEEGFKDTSSQSSTETESFDVGRAKWAGREKKSRRSFCRRIVLIQVVILLLFLSIAFGAYKLSRHLQTHNKSPVTLSNGTHNFAPTTILISLDGFRADFLNRNITPALNAFIASGVSPKYMLPSFPSVTFPNHFTLVTGLYPESHGIVGNQFWDPVLQEEFYYTDASRSMQPKWWTAEPLWVTAENQGVRSAIHMWPGSEAHISDVEPTYLDKFNVTEPLMNKIDRILGWLDLPGDDEITELSQRRPQLIAAYVPNVDEDGHKYGPNSTEIRQTIADADSMLTLLVEGLLVRNLTEIVNLIIVSDHGMATTSTSRLVQLDDIIDLSLVDHIDGWPLRGLRLKNPERDVPILYEQLLNAASPGFDVYTLDTMPERYHFTNNDRIAPLWVVPKTGWAVVEKKYFDVAEAQTIGKKFRPMGLHGYDHEHPLMRAIFVARGPAFPHMPNSRVPEFQNIEVYNIVCDSLGITPHPNNGTLRLPLKTVGLHTDVPQLDNPDDPDEPSDSGIFEKPKEEPPQPEKENVSESDEAENPADQPPPKDEQDEKDGKQGEDLGKTSGGWWDFVHDQLEKAKEWAKEIVDSLKGNEDKPAKNSNGTRG